MSSMRCTPSRLSCLWCSAACVPSNYLHGVVVVLSASRPPYVLKVQPHCLISIALLCPFKLLLEISYIYGFSCPSIHLSTHTINEFIHQMQGLRLHI